MQDTSDRQGTGGPNASDAEGVARTLAERVYAAFAQAATMPAHPLAEQTVLTRLVKAIRPHVADGSASAVVAAANGALDAWEAQDPDVRGPRVASVGLADATVAMRAA